jgi:hypothetical protein
MSSVRERVAALPLALKVVVAGVVVLVAFNLLARALDESVGGGEPSGAPASSFATAPEGVGAYAELLRRYDHPITRQRGDLVDAELPPTSTLMVLDPRSLDENEAGEALQFVVDGGRLVIGGEEPDRYLRSLRDRPPDWAPGGPTGWRGTAAPFAGFATTTDGTGHWDAMGTASPVVGTADRALLAREDVGRGEVLYLADVSPLTNEYLATRDNAAFGLELAGEEGRPVIFAEGVHGYGTRRGLGAVPQKWKLALGGIAIAALLMMWARARRLGPPEDAERPLPPPRRAYVDALAITLERTHDPDHATANVRDEVRARVAQRAGIAPDASPADLDRAAVVLGLGADERRVLLQGVTGDDDVLAIGRALVRVERWDRALQDRRDE